MHILIVEPFFTGSHASWAKQYQQFSTHQVDILSLAGKHWKWRMHGGAVTLARRFLEMKYKPDLILASDMLDLTTFLALVRNEIGKAKVAVYFHENQLNYPWSPEDDDPLRQRDLHYCFINYASALAADAVFFNSTFHKDAFLAELPSFLKSFPDRNELGTLDGIRRKSSVLSLGLDLRKFDPFKPATIKAANTRVPLILWNHRWEYDKNPKGFFEALFLLAGEGVPFEVAILGESFGEQAELFQQARQRLGSRVVQFGFARSFEDYATWLWRADILPVTSVHDFFGISVVEAMYCGCIPLLPDRLAYPEHIPVDHRSRFFYTDFDDLVCRLRKLIRAEEPVPRLDIPGFVNAYDWQSMARLYDTQFQSL